MAERFWEDGRIMEVESGSAFDFHFQTNLNMSSVDNIPNTGLKGSIEAAKANENIPAEGGALVVRRRRGRPMGSRNKPKNPLTGIREISDSMKSRVLEDPSGIDIIDIMSKSSSALASSQSSLSVGAGMSPTLPCSSRSL
jgi:hypothetical protein